MFVNLLAPCLALLDPDAGSGEGIVNASPSPRNWAYRSFFTVGCIFSRCLDNCRDHVCSMALSHHIVFLAISELSSTKYSLHLPLSSPLPVGETPAGANFVSCLFAITYASRLVSHL